MTLRLVHSAQPDDVDGETQAEKFTEPGELEVAEQHPLLEKIHAAVMQFGMNMNIARQLGHLAEPINEGLFESAPIPHDLIKLLESQSVPDGDICVEIVFNDSDSPHAPGHFECSVLIYESRDPTMQAPGQKYFYKKDDFISPYLGLFPEQILEFVKEELGENHPRVIALTTYIDLLDALDGVITVDKQRKMKFLEFEIGRDLMEAIYVGRGLKMCAEMAVDDGDGEDDPGPGAA